jgi:integrase
MVLKHLAELGVMSTSDLTTGTMVRYVSFLGDRGVTNHNTVNGYLSTLAAACTYAIEEGWLDRPPIWRRVRMRPTPMVKNVPPDPGELAELLAHLDRKTDWAGRRLCGMAWTVSLTGCRLGEAGYGWIEDLDLEREEYRVNPLRHPRSVAKTEASERVIPLPAVLVEVLRRWLPFAGEGPWLFPGTKRRGPWMGGQVGDRPLGHLQAAAKEVGIERITWHSLRHAYATFALEQGIPAWVVQQVLGHTDLRTTEGYLRLRNSPKIRPYVRELRYSAASVVARV